MSREESGASNTINQSVKQYVSFEFSTYTVSFERGNLFFFSLFLLFLSSSLALSLPYSLHLICDVGLVSSCVYTPPLLGGLFSKNRGPRR